MKLLLPERCLEWRIYADSCMPPDDLQGISLKKIADENISINNIVKHTQKKIKVLFRKLQMKQILNTNISMQMMKMQDVTQTFTG